MTAPRVIEAADLDPLAALCLRCDGRPGDDVCDARPVCRGKACLLCKGRPFCRDCFGDGWVPREHPYRGAADGRREKV